MSPPASFGSETSTALDLTSRLRPSAFAQRASAARSPEADFLRGGLFRGLRGEQPGLAREPAIDELLQPGALGNVIHRSIGKMLVTRLCARRIHAVIAARGPAMHHRVGDVGMELEAEGVAVP